MSLVFGVWFAASVVIAALYPSTLVRGLGMGRIYFSSAMLGFGVGAMAIVMRARARIAARRSPDGNDLIALALVVFDAAVIAVTFWPGGSGSFAGVPVLIISIFATISAVEVVAWLLIRCG